MANYRSVRCFDVPGRIRTTRARVGRAGGFEVVVAVDQEGEGDVLRAWGADLVVADLGDILEHALAA